MQRSDIHIARTLTSIQVCQLIRPNNNSNLVPCSREICSNRGLSDSQCSNKAALVKLDDRIGSFLVNCERDLHGVAKPNRILHAGIGYHRHKPMRILTFAPVHAQLDRMKALIHSQGSRSHQGCRRPHVLRSDILPGFRSNCPID